ncbi:ABC transporter ATP-binding protein [Sansalvadorimonas sp. 2012CJ34-2]|uniref:Nickel import system ATP-binding protein NikD n=1 Tax=Parendozoicomonas callyspongiae TaxID=2942213 RepID=A0ABT0PJ85_9GAMM|nr:ABC transporter ATP-binding protein [Sansalvadorimonas sp. 2012CJ34-2]MCL6271326.1 ABC transporter ATP-binding protein [Sansalvadorimonas sp. 2012CJ34-2]
MNKLKKEPLFKVKDLVIDLYTEQVSVRAVDSVNLEVNAGEILAVVGESGSGKTVMTLGPLGLLPEGVSVDIRGQSQCSGQDLLNKPARELAKLRGENFGIIFQDPISALNPMKKVGPQLASQAVRLRGVSKQQGKEIAIELLQRTGIPDPEDRYNRYPHEMSGGMLQRVMIALALVGNPKILIADEPITALDATVQAQILELLKDIQCRENIAIILITHDISVVAQMADQVAVLYAGRIAEYGTMEDVLTRPVHPYTKGLLSSVPDLRSKRGENASGPAGITGSPPDQSSLLPGCRFVERCPVAQTFCSKFRPPLEVLPHLSQRHFVACPVAVESTIEQMEGEAYEQ